MAGITSTEQTELPAYQVVRRQRIIDAGKDLLRTQDYDSIQIRDVASEANVALGTLYRYFNSKEHLYANVVYDWAVPFAQLPANSEAGMTTTEQISRRLRNALNSFEKHPYFYKAILQLRSSTAEDVAPVMAKLSEVLEAPIRGEMSGLDDAEAADITVMVWAVLLDVVSRVLLQDKSMEQASEVLDRFVGMIRHRLEHTEA